MEVAFLSMEELARLVLIGVGATAVTGVWSLVQKGSGIGKADPLPAERPLGWLIHYALGIAFAALLVGVTGVTWLHDPAWMPALTVGTLTVVIPFFVMQPAMGVGIAASRTPTAWTTRLHSLLTHAVFGSGLYLLAALLGWVSQ